MLPLFVNVRERLAVVVGGGAVGRRKMAALLRAQAHVRLVCLEPRPADCPPPVEWLTEPYEPRHLHGATLVLAAATAEVNQRVTADARQLGLWVNAATQPEQSDFFLPSVLHRGELVIAVGTGGAAPALARAVRLLLESQLDEAFTHWVALLAELRPLIHQQIADPQQRSQLMAQLCHNNWLDQLRHHDPATVRHAMLAAITAAAEPPP